MGLGPIVNGKQLPISQYKGSWADTVNSTPMPAAPIRKVLALGTCKADGSDFKPYDKPVERELPAPSGSYLWLDHASNDAPKGDGHT